MEKLTLGLLASLICFTASAEKIATYKQNFTLTRTGGGTTYKVKVQGYLILGVDSDFVRFVNVYPATKDFAVTEPAFKSGNANSGKNKFVSSVELEEGDFQGLTLKGIDKPSPLFVPYAMPRTLTISGADIWGDENEFLDEFKGAMVLDKTNSSSNGSGEQTLQRIKNVLFLKGYHEY